MVVDAAFRALPGRDGLRKGWALLLALVCGWAPSGSLAADRAVIVKFKEHVGPSERALVRLRGGRPERVFRVLPALSARLPEAAVAALRADPRVEYVEEDGVVSWAETVQGDEYAASWGAERIGARAAHELGITGQGVKVAVLDTGVDASHPELAAAFRGGYDFVEDDEDPFDESFNGHGTHVAGIIAASRDGQGIVGVAPGVDLLVVRVLDGAGFGLISWIVQGIEWAVEHGAEVINLSISTSRHFQALQDACDAAAAAGVVVVAAAGNTNGGEPTYPARYASVVGVTGTDREDRPAYFAPEGEGIALSAPGVEILSAQPGGGFGSLEGTSMASPHVAGAVALVLAAGVEDVDGDGLRSDEARDHLLYTARDLGEPGPDALFGHGLVDVEAAVGSLVSPWFRTVVLRRVEGAPWASVTVLPLAGGAFRLQLAQADGVASVRVLVYGGGGQGRRERTRPLLLSARGARSEAIVDATEGVHRVVLVPQGAPGGTAVLTVTRTGVGAAQSGGVGEGRDEASGGYKGLVRLSHLASGGAPGAGRRSRGR
ncbi:MAG: S8 family peptidase [Deferrisomatales bacterium]